jgi:hypothetical protein
MTALYLSSFKDHGVLTRLLSLPANIVRDATDLSVINSNERQKKETELVAKMNDLQKRLDTVQAQNPTK